MNTNRGAPLGFLPAVAPLIAAAAGGGGALSVASAALPLVSPLLNIFGGVFGGKSVPTVAYYRWVYKPAVSRGGRQDRTKAGSGEWRPVNVPVGDPQPPYSYTLEERNLRPFGPSSDAGVVIVNDRGEPVNAYGQPIATVAPIPAPAPASAQPSPAVEPSRPGVVSPAPAPALRITPSVIDAATGAQYEGGDGVYLDPAQGDPSQADYWTRWLNYFVGLVGLAADHPGEYAPAWTQGAVSPDLDPLATVRGLAGALGNCACGHKRRQSLQGRGLGDWVDPMSIGNRVRPGDLQGVLAAVANLGPLTQAETFALIRDAARMDPQAVAGLASALAHTQDAVLGGLGDLGRKLVIATAETMADPELHGVDGLGLFEFLGPLLQNIGNVVNAVAPVAAPIIQAVAPKSAPIVQAVVGGGQAATAFGNALAPGGSASSIFGPPTTAGGAPAAAFALPAGLPDLLSRIFGAYQRATGNPAPVVPGVNPPAAVRAPDPPPFVPPQGGGGGRENVTVKDSGGGISNGTGIALAAAAVLGAVLLARK